MTNCEEFEQSVIAARDHAEGDSLRQPSPLVSVESVAGGGTGQLTYVSRDIPVRCQLDARYDCPPIQPRTCDMCINNPAHGIADLQARLEAAEERMGWATEYRGRGWLVRYSPRSLRQWGGNWIASVTVGRRWTRHYLTADAAFAALAAWREKGEGE